MLQFLRQLLPTQAATRKPQPRTLRPRFRPAMERLDDRITPTLGFATQLPFTVGTGPESVAVGDINGDGRADVVSANTGADNGTTVSVLLNTTPNGAATPTFAVKQDFTVGTAPTFVVIADFNGDGRADIATSNFATSNVSVLLNTTPNGAAALSFAAKQDFAIGTSPIGLAVGDFNGDGRLDLVDTNSGADTVSVLLNTTPMQSGLAAFAARTTFATGSGPRAVAVGDFNADGRMDVAVANSGFTNNVSVLLNTTAIGAATPTFAAQQTFAVGTTPLGIAVGDFNGDGRLDLATANGGATTASVLLNTTTAGAATPTFAAKQDFAVGTPPWGIAVADFDGDGRTDIATANYGNGAGTTVSVLLNTTAVLATTPTFAAKQDTAVGADPLGIAVGDFTGDGRPDFVTANYGSGAGTTVSVVANTSTNVLPTTTSPALVVQVGTAGGVAAYKRDTGTWVTLTGANANALAASASGNVIASFGGNGVYYYRAAGQTWTQINGIQAVAVAIDPLGNAYASFAGFGTYIYRLATGSFQQITGAVASILAASGNGDVVGNFPGFGIYRYQRTAPQPFYQINGYNADSLAVDRNGYVVAAFGGFGVGQYIPYASGWRTVAPAVAATSVAFDGSGNVYASIPGFGVGKFDYTNTWKNLAPGASATSLAADWYGNVFASFAGWPGVWEYNPSYGWQWKYQSPVTLVSLAA